MGSSLATRAQHSVGQSRGHWALARLHRVLLDWVGRLPHTMCTGPLCWFQPIGRFKIENPFLFSFGLNSNFENSFLSVQGSKNNETGSVGFVIL
jgi:hypothetical protein